MEKKTKVGRKKKYDTQMLIGLVNKYADENPYSVIKIADLTKRFEIKHYIWRDYTEVRKYIDKLNNTSKILSMPKENIALNSVDDFFIKNKGDKDLKQAVSDLFETNNKLYKLALKADKFIEKEQDYLKQIEYKDKEIKKLKDAIDALNKEIDSLYIDSRSTKIRQDKGIKDNVIKLIPDDKKLSKSIEEIEESFPGLFLDL